MDILSVIAMVISILLLFFGLTPQAGVMMGMAAVLAFLHLADALFAISRAWYPHFSEVMAGAAKISKGD